MGYERRLVELLEWRRGQGDSLSNRLHLDHFVLSTQFDHMWFAYHHEYSAPDCNFENLMRINCWLDNTFIVVRKAEVFVLRFSTLSEASCASVRLVG